MLPDRPRAIAPSDARGKPFFVKSREESPMTSNDNVAPKAVARGTELSVQLALKGLSASPPPQSSLVLGSQSYTLSDLTSKLQVIEASYQKRRDLEQQLASARAFLKENAEANAQFLRNLRSALRGMLGNQNAQLLAYGVKPLNKPRPLTSDERTLAVARLRATRKKRGTLGPKARAAIRADAPSAVNVVRDVPGEPPATPPPAPAGGAKPM
jgi:hypothetical protein